MGGARCAHPGKDLAIIGLGVLRVCAHFGHPASNEADKPIVRVDERIGHPMTAGVARSALGELRSGGGTVIIPVQLGRRPSP